MNFIPRTIVQSLGKLHVSGNQLSPTFLGPLGTLDT